MYSRKVVDLNVAILESDEDQDLDFVKHVRLIKKIPGGSTERFVLLLLLSLFQTFLSLGLLTLWRGIQRM